MSTREEVIARSGGSCEAMLVDDKGMRFRCGKSGVEVHHMITRARGGLILDEEGETHHLLALCMEHHKAAHDLASSDLLLDGYVIRDNATGQAVYYGSDDYLSRKYAKAA